MAPLCYAVWLFFFSALFLFASTFANSDEMSLPAWKRELLHVRWWKGHYSFNRVSHPCKLTVRSVQYEDAGGVSVTFTADSTVIDMNAYSSDDIRIVFREETKFNGSDHFYDNFEFLVEMLPQGQLLVIVGNITRPANNFSAIRFQPDATPSGTNYAQSSSQSIGIAVGVSIFLFIACTIAGIIILRWALKKGYLRHVATSYKFFRNPDTPVSFDNSEQGSGPDDVQFRNLASNVEEDDEDDYDYPNAQLLR